MLLLLLPFLTLLFSYLLQNLYTDWTESLISIGIEGTQCCYCQRRHQRQYRHRKHGRHREEPCSENSATDSRWVVASNSVGNSQNLTFQSSTIFNISLPLLYNNIQDIKYSIFNFQFGFVRFEFICCYCSLQESCETKLPIVVCNCFRKISYAAVESQVSFCYKFRFYSKRVNIEEWLNIDQNKSWPWHWLCWFMKYVTWNVNSIMPTAKSNTFSCNLLTINN